MELIFTLSLCVASVLGVVRVSPPPNSLGEAPDPIFTFMQRTYADDRGRITSNAGSPLFLTPYIEENKLNEARTAAAVDNTYTLPGIESYAGYLTVNKEYNANLWFWYFPVSDKKSVEDTPWIIWLQGGPGTSSLLGLFAEIGPLFVTENNTLEEIKYSWGKNHSLLFIDNPVGTGFSFADDDRGYPTNQTTIGENLYNALQQFLTIFPELRKAPLTIAGEQYAGKHVPSLGVQILWHRQEDEPINLQGMAIGNGFIDPLTLQKNSYFVREIGLVDDNVADDMKQREDAVVQLINDGETLKAFRSYMELLSRFLSKTQLQNPSNFLKDQEINLNAYVDYLQRDDVQRALHVGNITPSDCRIVFNKLMPDFMNSAKMWLEELLENYRVMLYSGHLDVIIAYHSSVNTYRSLNFSGSSDYKNGERKLWFHNNTLAGYYKTAANLTEVMVRGAGHLVTVDKPAAALGLISAFARGISLEKDTKYLVDV